MSDKKITQLTAAAAANQTDLLEKVNDPAGTPASQKVSVLQLGTNILANITSMTFPTSGATVTQTANRLKFEMPLFSNFFYLDKFDQTVGIQGGNATFNTLGYLTWGLGSIGEGHLLWNGIDSVRWDIDHLVTGGNVTVDWGACVLGDVTNAGARSIDWDGRTLNDSTGIHVSLDYQNRVVKDESGLQIIGWYKPQSTGTDQDHIPSFPNGDIGTTPSNGAVPAGWIQVFINQERTSGAGFNGWIPYYT